MSELALELVRDCLKKKKQYLDLGNCGLTDDHFADDSPLDIELRKCVHLFKLILSDEWRIYNDELKSRNSGKRNVLNSLPACLSSLSSLKSLVCCGSYEGRWGITNMAAISSSSTLEHIDLSHNQIKELNGLDNLLDLQSLSISHNQIIDLKGLSNLKSLKSLSIPHNQITEIKGLDNATSLLYLNISNNQIREIKGINKLTSLQSLILSSNQINELKGLDNLSALQKLFISHNQIREIKGLAHLSALKNLSIPHNQIRELGGLENLVALEKLYIFNNQITELKGLENLTLLQNFTISNNQIAELKGLENLSALQYFNISNNQIKELKGLENLSSLQNFTISDNQITELKGLENLSALQYFTISNNQISELKGLDSFKYLKNLNISGNEIDSISGVDNLTSLQKLDLSYNYIQELKGLNNLLSLQNFDVSDNQIWELKGLEHLSELQYFYISHNQINELKGLNNLTKLQRFYIVHNQIDELKGLDALVTLKNFHIYNNRITELKGLDNLSLLQDLDVSHNQISEIKGLDNLFGLRKLDLSANKILDIQKLLPFIKKSEYALKVIFQDPKYSISQYQINLQDNPLINPPIEIARQGNRAILNYFSELDKHEKDYLYEAKMLIVGQPRAGKTSLRYKLFDSTSNLPEEEKTTRGIDIQQLNFDLNDGGRNKRKFFYSIWDFGGQHIYQTTHQFFLTHSSLYVLVVDTGKNSLGNEDGHINYWLQAVELLGGNSPLLLIANEKNDRKLNIDIPQKRARFAFLKSDYGLNLNALIPGTTSYRENQLKIFDSLKLDIQYQLSSLPLVGLSMPKNWIAIRDQLQELSTSNPFISKDEFRNICRKNDLIDYEMQMELSLIFHDLGIFLHFQGITALEDFIILQNTWATDAVFAVLDDEGLQKNKGKFMFSDLDKIWTNKLYELEAHSKLLQLMMQFELCYQIEWSNPRVYIIPEMLADAAPVGCVWEADADLPLFYRYDFMPKGILTRLIVRLHRGICLYETEQVVWKTGVRIDGKMFDCLNTEAEIIEAWDNKQLNIRAHGPFAKELLTRISHEVDQLNNEYFRHVSQDEATQKSRWYKMIPCTCVTCNFRNQKHFYKYNDLVKRKLFGKKTIECEMEPFSVVEISELLDGIFVKTTEPTPNFKSNIMNEAKIFVSYSNKDRGLRELLINGIKEHLDSNPELNYDIWADNEIDLGTNWREDIEKALKNSDAAILLVSASFAASKFIKENELAKFFKRKAEEGYMILPVLLRNYKFSDFEQLSDLNFFKTYYNQYGYNKPTVRNKLMPFDVLGDDENVTDKQLQDYYCNLADYIHTAVMNHLKR